MVFKTVIGFPQFANDPTALNSNLLPVKANGEVLFLSVLSSKISGQEFPDSQMWVYSICGYDFCYPN